MIAYGTKALGAQRRRAIDVDGDLFHKGEWMDSGQTPGLAPTVFLVEQGADILLQPHFHRQNQFQLFVAGDGTIGSEPIRPITLHYAGAYTGYGPIKSGPGGLKYFTIRFFPIRNRQQKDLLEWPRGSPEKQRSFSGCGGKLLA